MYALLTVAVNETPDKLTVASSPGIPTLEKGLLAKGPKPNDIIYPFSCLLIP